MENRTLQAKPDARTEGLVVQELSDEVLVYDLDRHKAHCLNETAAFVWQQCDGTATVDDISGRLASKFDAPVDEDVVWSALLQLEKSHLLQSRVTQTPGARKVTRRELLRKGGLAAAVALPLITSVVAPTTAAARSCVPFKGLCDPKANFCCTDAKFCQFSPKRKAFVCSVG
jgi:hypothetical protein